MRMYAYRQFSWFATFVAFLSFCVNAEESDGEMFDLPLPALLGVSIESVSGIDERIADAPASLIVITGQDIRERGYHSLHEIFADLPGFDAYINNGTRFMNVYQRGYRTPETTRTLFLVNGKVQNDLWDHSAHMQRQWPLTNVKRIEVLYGPASVVYGPNAFLGIVNVITNDGSELRKEQEITEIRAGYGSYDTQLVDISARGNHGMLKYAISARLFQSDEPGLDDFGKSYGWLNDRLLSDRDIWGGILDLYYDGRAMGSYQDPSDDWGVMADLTYGNLKVSYIGWQIDEGYGPDNPADRAQPGASWNKSANQLSLEHHGYVNDIVKIKSTFSQRENRVYGGWAEAVPADDDARYSYISFSDWDTRNKSFLFEQSYAYRPNAAWSFNGGIRVEIKELTKAFDVCGYWSGTICSSSDEQAGPLGLGAGVDDSRSATYQKQSQTTGNIPAFNLIKTKDKGAFFQTVWDENDWRLSAGIRSDHNSEFGEAVNPRLSALYRLTPDDIIKFIYAEAYQEPPNILLYGGWNGRDANPDLKAERLYNYELIYIHQFRNWRQEISLYQSRFSDVLKEEAENAGKREVLGAEYRATFEMANVIENAKPIKGFFYYTYTDNTSSVRYVHNEILPEDSGWQDGDTDIGDIAPHKLNLGFNLPFSQYWSVNVRGQYHGETKLYSRNPLRHQGDELDAYTLFNMALNFSATDFYIGVKVDNLFNEKYFTPGTHAANAGNQFDEQRSAGFYASLIPMPQRSYLLQFGTLFR